MKKKFTTCLWFDQQAEDAAKFYSTVFKNTKAGRIARYSESGSQVSGQKKGSVLTVELEIEDINVVALNGGPMFKFSPSFSFFVRCESQQEIEDKWKKLSAGGQVRMGLDQYPWAERYGWTTDQFGVDWQLILAPGQHQISPALLFVNQLFGKGEEAINFYMSLFPNSKIETIARDEASKTVMHCAFTLNGQSFVLMEGAGKHEHSFTHATSLMVMCEDQAEVDRYWDRLSEGGSIEQCGWVKDKYGVSWQIVPTVMAELMPASDPAKSERVMKAMLQMKKIDIAKLKAAAAG